MNSMLQYFKHSNAIPSANNNNIALFDKIKTIQTIFYTEETVENHWNTYCFWH